MPILPVKHMLEQLLQPKPQFAVSKPQLVRLCQILMFCESGRLASIKSSSKERLLQLCMDQAWTRSDLFGTQVWSWLWDADPTQPAVHRLQQKLVCKLTLRKQRRNEFIYRCLSCFLSCVNAGAMRTARGSER